MLKVNIVTDYRRHGGVPFFQKEEAFVFFIFRGRMIYGVLELG